MKKVILLVLAVIFTVSTVYSQQTLISAKKNPLVTIETSGSIDLPMMDLKASSSTNAIGGFYKFTDYGANIGFGPTLSVKFGVYNGKQTQLRTYLTIGYSHFTNDENKATVFSEAGWVHIGYPHINPVTGQQYITARDTAGISNMRINLPSISVGCELGVYTDKRHYSSFNFGLDVGFNVIFGKYYQTIVGQTETYTTLNPNFRMGLGLNTSYSYRFSKVVGFHVGTRFAILNLIGKSSDVSDGDAAVYLLDKGDTSLNPNLISSRTLGYLRFFGGLSIFL